MTAPPLGLTTEVEYVRILDGDTIEFEIRRRFKVRLEGIDVYEKNTEQGEEATDFVDNILLDAEVIKVFIPSNNPIKLMDINSFSRIVGQVYVDDTNLTDLLRAAHYDKNQS